MDYHDKALVTAEAAEAAGAQGAFWEMHDLLYDRHDAWSQLPADQMPEILAGYAQELGLDVTRFTADLEDHTYQQKVMTQYRDAANMQLQATPTIIINGQPYPFGLSYEGLEAFIDQMLQSDLPHYDSPPAQVVDPGRQYFATVRTSAGDMVIELYADRAPINVNSFVFLAQEGWYDGVSFFRVVEDVLAVTGDPTVTVVGHPGYACDDEIDPDLGFDDAGVVGMVNFGLNMASSQFFITLSAQPDLSGGLSVIGRVVEGWDVLEGLAPREPDDPDASPAEVIETILVEER